MLKNRKIGTKLLFGIGLMVVIISLVIGYTIYNLQLEKMQADTLQNKYVENLKIVFEFKDHVANVMYNMRAYGLSGEMNYYNEGVLNMEDASENLDELKQFAARFPEDTALQEGYNTAVEAHATYYEAIQGTYDAMMAMSTGVKKLDNITNQFVEESTNYYEDQVQKLRDQIDGNDSDALLLDREQKIHMITDIINRVNDIRVSARTAIAANDAAALIAASKQFDVIHVTLDELFAITKQQYNIDQLNVIHQNAEDYADTLVELAGLYTDLSTLGDVRKQSGDSLQAVANTLSSTNMNSIIVASEETVSGVNNTTNVLIYGFILALLIGIVINAYIVRGLTKSIKGLTSAAETLATGDVDVNLEAKGKDEIGIMTIAFNKMIDSIKAQADIASKIADGHRDIDVVVKSDKDILNMKLKDAVQSLNLLLHETDKLTKAVMKGDLSERGKEGVLKGVWNDLIVGINQLIDAFVNPINLTNEYVTMLGNGVVPEKIDTEYYGDFNEIKVSINRCIDGIDGLVADTNELIDAAQSGDLAYRADASKHMGQYGRIIKGINETLDATTKPVMEASAVLKEMAAGNLKVKMTGEYKGDHNVIKQALNQTITSLVGYIDEIAMVLGRMGEGDFTVRVTRKFEGDFIAIQEAFVNILDSLNKILGDINVSAEQVSSGAGQVSASSQALSQGSTEQASSIEEITSAMTQVAEQTKENALNANKANALTVKAKDGAISGNEQMQGMVDAMREINESSKNISKIIKVIDEIAFQTNILALNAAVEAARAGEHGKGFAVVAEEVRNLAARSANAAKETTGLIENSINKVESGTEIANVTAKSLSEIVEGVSEVATLVSTISNASNEQAIAISQINEGVNQISDVTQNNTATAEETAAASEEMSAQAELLKDMISKFELTTKTHHVVQPKAEKREEKTSAQSPKHIQLDDTEFGKY
jgi:methyl-accepting chemotaxis protein